MSEHPPPLCQRCGAVLAPGRGNFYVVRIESFADPTPPSLTPEDLQADLNAEFSRLMEEMAGMSAQELMDQVYRRLAFYLCSACYRQWIEDPTRTGTDSGTDPVS